jgi:tripartite-type tricarboxylate transporter receptor subunit TctC
VRKRKLATSLLVALISMAALTISATAQSYPTRIIRIIVSTPPGGVQDALARYVGKDLSEKLGQPVVIENRPGANSILAAQLTADAPPDGYTLFMGTDATLSINPHLYSKLSYNPNDFVGVSQLVVVYQHLYVSAELPVRTLPEFVTYAKANPGKLNYGSFGYGSNPHLAAERLKQITGTDIFHIPFKGNTDTMVALATNQIQMIIASLNPVVPLIQTGKARVLAVSGSKRISSLPDVQTFAEAGYPQFESKFWLGLVARRGTPDAIRELISKHVNNYVHSDAFKEIVPRYTFEVVGNSPNEFDRFMAADREQYQRLIAQNKIEKLE